MKLCKKLINILLLTTLLSINIYSQKSLEKFCLSPKTSFSQTGQLLIERKSFNNVLIPLLITGLISLCTISCSKDEDISPMAPDTDTTYNDSTYNDTTDNDTIIENIPAIQKLYDYTTGIINLHLQNEINNTGLPHSRASFKDYNFSPTHPDRSYTYDLGRLMIYTAKNKKLWRSEMTGILNSLSDLQDIDNFLWTASYGDNGSTESETLTGPSLVAARGLLMWSEHSAETDRFEDAAISLADYLLDNPSHQIKISDNFIIKQNISDPESNASTEENARACKLFLEIYSYLSEEGSHQAASKYLQGAESILKAFINLRGSGTIYPFGVSNDGLPVFDMYGREGIDAEIIMIQAFQQYFDQVPTENHDSLIQSEYDNNLEPIMEWVRATFQNDNIILNLPENQEIIIPLSYPKRINENEIWPEIMADIMLVELQTFNNQSEYEKLLESLIILMEFNPYLPTLLAAPDGYNQPPVWNYGAEMNKPYGSLVNLVILAEFLELLDLSETSSLDTLINDFISQAA